ncbi:hypothetical protein Afil01_38620 [Actinorhabdospora filicis]|uniref:Uncharacterized protein n=1 Tax=Actinorhabdospora filicis TaxID=1785913 RepID=A0A9W6WBT7_9ACTN|nr:hypothetical protein [Actinorhabdospora filicis]GLZ79055.1 hypothetical protein Afil01_38620 [Actinorhabdospora filicis]
MIQEATPETPVRHGRVRALGLVAVVVITAGGLVSWFLTRGGCGGRDYVTDDATRLCYAIPAGWDRAPGAAPGVLEGTASGGAKAEPMPGYAGDPERLTELAVEYAGIARDDPALRYSRVQTSTGSIDGHDAVSAFLWYERDAGRPAEIHVRLTAIEVEPGTWSLLSSVGFSDDEADAVDEIHDNLDVMS